MARSALQFSLDTYKRVQILVGAGWSERDMAALLGISRKTFRKAFKEDLEMGRLRCRAEVVEALYRAACAPGRVSAAKAWMALTAEPAPNNGEG